MKTETLEPEVAPDREDLTHALRCLIDAVEAHVKETRAHAKAGPWLSARFGGQYALARLQVAANEARAVLPPPEE